MSWTRRSLNIAFLTLAMASVLRGRVDFGQCLAQYPAGLLAIGVATQQHALGERQLVAGLTGQHVQVYVQYGLECRLAVVDDDVVAVGMQSGSSCRLGDSLPDANQIGTGFGRGVGQVDGVALRDDERVAASEGPDVEDPQVAVVLIYADRRGLARDYGAEQTSHKRQANLSAKS